MTLIIAEAGVNHNGSEALALKLVEVAAEAGADVVKFQTFQARKLAAKSARMAEYQKANLGGSEESQLEMLSRLELSPEMHRALLKRSQDLGIEFLSTAFDEESLTFLASEMQLRRLKLPSGEITNAPLALAHAMTGFDIIVSTGMATLGEIEAVLGVIAYGYLSVNGVNVPPPSRAAFADAYSTREGQTLVADKVTLLHCTTEYPAPLEEVNLNAMRTLGSAFGLRYGYSDHTDGIEIPIAAAALGACVIEKHFTLDRSMKGPDHKASLDPAGLKKMIHGIRSVETAMGTGVKSPTLSERKNKNIARKSLVAAADIKRGELFAEENLTVMRPGTGMSPFDYWSLLGSPSPRDFSAGDVIDV